ncbi:hypothetical protein [Citrobacter freundii]|uniref:hypothetical protein n=1 Tax=Citrobacter freundii TaxID=546 RepID=UPI00374F8196
MKPTYEELAVQLANAESKCRELAAESVGLKAAINEHSEGFTVCTCCGTEHDSCHDDVCRALNETPATDAFLAEVRAQESKRVYESILDNPSVTDMESLVDWLEQNASDSASFADQLRKGAEL